MAETRAWLKSVGSSDDPMADEWPTSAPQELEQVHFPDKGKPSVRPGDYLVYYAPWHQRIIGIVEVFMPPSKDSGEERWPWRCLVRPRVIISRIERCPSIDAASGPSRNLRGSIQQQSHIVLAADEYVRARHSLEQVFDPSRGDLLYPWPTFATNLVAGERD